MYIGGVGAAGLHHLVWEILDNSIDEAMNGYASNIRVTLHKDGSSITIDDDGRGIPVDKHPKTKKSALEVIFTVLHAGGKFEHGNYKTAGGLHGVGASVVNALSTELVATVRRDGAQWEMTLQAGQADRRPEEGRRGARQRHDGLLPSRPDDLPEDGVRRRRRSASGSRWPATSTGASRSPSRTSRPARKDVFQHAEGLVDYLKKIVGERQAKPVHEAPFVLEKDERRAARARAAVDRVHRRAHPQLRQRHPDRLGRHARERPARRHRQGGPQLHRDAQPVAQGRHAHRRGHPRGHDRRAVGLHPGAAVPGADQGPAEQPRGALGGGRLRPPGARALAEQQPAVAEAIVGAHHPRGAGARGQPRRAAGGDAQGRRPRAASTCRASSPTARTPARRRASCSSSRAIRPAGRPSRDATARARRSCRCAARCSTPRACRLAKVLENKELSDLVTALGCGVGQEVRPRRACATARSSCWWTPTRTATTSRRCCSRSSTATCRS